KSAVTLQLDTLATLLASPVMADFTVGGKVVNLLNGPGTAIHDVVLTGAGTIDGNGAAWWAAFQANSALVRPRLIGIANCQNLTVTGLTLTNSPSFHLVPSQCQNVVITKVKIKAPATSPNTDGIDPANCDGVTITNCLIDTGDDNIAIKGGRRNLVGGAQRGREQLHLHGHYQWHPHQVRAGSGWPDSERELPQHNDDERAQPTHHQHGLCPQPEQRLPHRRAPGHGLLGDSLKVGQLAAHLVLNRVRAACRPGREQLVSRRGKNPAGAGRRPAAARRLARQPAAAAPAQPVARPGPAGRFRPRRACPSRARSAPAGGPGPRPGSGARTAARRAWAGARQLFRHRAGARPAPDAGRRPAGGARRSGPARKPMGQRCGTPSEVGVDCPNFTNPALPKHFSFQFWVAAVVTGVAAGLAAGLLMKLLRLPRWGADGRRPLAGPPLLAQAGLGTFLRYLAARGRAAAAGLPLQRGALRRAREPGGGARARVGSEGGGRGLWGGPGQPRPPHPARAAAAGRLRGRGGHGGRLQRPVWRGPLRAGSAAGLAGAARRAASAHRLVYCHLGLVAAAATGAHVHRARGGRYPGPARLERAFRAAGRGGVGRLRAAGGAGPPLPAGWQRPLVAAAGRVRRPGAGLGAVSRAAGQRPQRGAERH
nr:probable polygalacturonase [Tanacetum cinerariifolium]